MPKFFWTGVDMFANTHSGYLYATTQKELDIKLFSQNIALLSSKQIRTFKRAALSDGQRGNIYAYFARLLDAGLLVPDALQSVAEGIDNVKIYDMMCDIITRIRQGTTLSDAMSMYPLIAPSSIAYVLTAGEQSGKLSGSCTSIATYYKQVDAIKKKIRTSLFMPGITLAAFLCIIVFVVGMVVPRFADLLQSFNQELPSMTQWILYFSECCTLTFGVYLLVFVGVTLVGYWYARTKEACKKVFDYMLMYTPVFGSLFQLSLYAHIFQSLSLLLATGVRLPRALQLVGKNIENQYVAQQVGALEDAVHAGKTLSEAMRRYVPLCSGYAITSLLRVGESSGGLSDSCAYIADEFFTKLHEQLSRLTKLIQPICIILLGLCIALLMIALYAPMMNISFEM